MRLKDAYFGGLMDKVAVKPATTRENQEIWEFSEYESWSNNDKGVAGTPVAQEKGTGRPVASRSSENSENPEAEKKKWSHHFYKSSAMVPHIEKNRFGRKKALRWKLHGRLG